MKIFRDHLPRMAVRRSAAAALLFVGLSALLLSGCGGGGGGGGSSSSTSGGGGSSSTTTYTGTVTNTTTGVVPVGDTVEFDSGPTTTVSSSGTYSLTVSNSLITGNDTIYVLSSISNSVVASTAVPSGSTTVNVVIGPPAPPSSTLDKKQ